MAKSADPKQTKTAEEIRLDETREHEVPWKLWGPYLSERQWGTVREDYSENGDAWNYFTHDQARSRAYHWGEDGLAGISDEHQRLCFSIALWNGKDPILKERLFGLTNSEGNHGEDVKEYYYYLDSTPTHSYMKYLYKYPQNAYPYSDLVETNRRRGRYEPEYELLDTGIFNEDRYFDVFVEYAKKAPTDIHQIADQRRREADEFYQAKTPPHIGPDATNMLRQAYAGMLWSKQYFFLDANKWLEEHGADPLRPTTRIVRNREWFHMVSDDVFSMPDKWEYPWFAAWDLAFHSLALSMVDIDCAKQQLDLLLDQVYLHPTGQIPAYEWNFSDVNPPVQAFAAIFLYRTEQALHRRTDLDFLKRVFGKLTANFGWWVNRKDRSGNNLYEGGFLGLDNIGVFDRSAPLPTGGYLEQADGTAWVALFCENMLEIACELATFDSTYEDLAANYALQLVLIARSLNAVGTDGMWDEEDGFYYDVLRLPNGTSTRLKVRSMVGLLPLCATVVTERAQREKMPKLVAQYQARLRQMPELLESLHPTGPGHYGVAEHGIIGLVNPQRLRRILTRMLDENEFLSPYGIRSLSRYHAEHPYVFPVHSQEYRVSYLPAESDSGMFGGNSNWRGPIWVPVNTLIIRALMHYFAYHGNNFKIECPTGSGRLMNLFEVAQEITSRLARIFLRDETGRRPVFGGSEKFQRDPYWRDHLLFYEYFHGDNGAGIGASHQTGWTGVVAGLVEYFGHIDAQSILQGGLATALEKAKETFETGT